MSRLVRAEEAKRSPDYYADGYPDMSIRDGVAYVSHADFKRLPTYSTSIPTGVCDGKVWKRGPHGGPPGFKHQAMLVPGNWFLGRFEAPAEPDADYVNTSFIPLVVDRV